MTQKKYILILFTILNTAILLADHIVGGEITYECTGNYNYKIVLTVYRDCNSQGATFDAPAALTIFNGDNSINQVVQVYYTSISPLQNIPPNGCTQLPSSVCTEMAIYETTIYLPPASGGYTISYQRCCRNQTITNITNSDDWGSTYTVTIPPNDAACNSTPTFNTLPPTVLCLNTATTVDFSVTENDGDSVAYVLCSPLHGGGTQQGTGAYSPKPDTAMAPPYTNVPFAPGYSVNAPIPSSPALSLSQNGMLSIRPTAVGQFAIAVCVYEFANGQLLSTVRRDFQFNVSGGCIGTTSYINPQDQSINAVCIGRTINFTQQCLNTTSYFWDFGDPNTLADTSRLANPTYTYNDTGSYLVTLIADPDGQCSDTSESLFMVFDSLWISFDITGKNCFDENSFDFFLSGNFTNNAQITWDFGGNTNLGNTISNITNPNGVTYNQPGFYYVTATVEEFECMATFSERIEISERPELVHIVPQTAGCIPLTVNFTDQSSGSDLQHFWTFGDGLYSTDPNPVHTYDSSGTFTISHQIMSTSGCIDTLIEEFQNHIEVWDNPKVNSEVNPKQANFNEGPFTITIEYSDDVLTSLTYLPNGDTIANLDSTTFEMVDDTGAFIIETIAVNEFGCSDTAQSSFRIIQPLFIELPNAFTPNGDGLNDVFSYSLSGVRRHTFYIYNRWGEAVFVTSDQNISWDGTDGKGKKAPAGVYSYRFRANLLETNQDYYQNGTITLIR